MISRNLKGQRCADKQLASPDSARVRPENAKGTPDGVPFEWNQRGKPRRGA